MDVEIRAARGGDLAHVFDLFERWVTEGETRGQAGPAPGDLETHLGPYFWVAVRDGEIVGFCYASARTSEGQGAVLRDGERYVEIDELYVRPDLRSQGIGHALLDRVLEEAAARGVTRSLVYSASAEWDRVVRFYERSGYRMWFIRMVR